MNDLQGIGVKVVTATGNAKPLLREIAALLESLANGGPGGSIDLRRLPMLSGDHAVLDQTLGEGEVSAEITALGPTRIRETGIHGVWRVIHCNADGEPVAEFIEVARMPAILATPDEDIQDGLERLRDKLRRQE